jgi:hypothetical protein
MILTVVFVFLYKFFDELQDESVNSAWEKGPVNFLNKYPEHLFQLFKDICIGLAIASASSSPWIGLAAFLATFLLGLVKEARK